MKNILEINGLKAEKGTKVQGFINVLDTDKKIPVTLINGAKEGKSLLITAGVHGGEYPCIKAAIEISKEINPAEVNGKIVIVHPVNVEGFFQRRPAVVPEDNKNLNNIFPGKKDGTIAEKIAYMIVNEMQQNADFHLDIHGGDLNEALTPHLYYSGKAKQEIIDKIKEMAKVLDVKYMVKSNTTTGVHSYGSISGIPSMLLERGGKGLCLNEDVKAYKKDLYSILNKMQILISREDLKEKMPIDITEANYLEALNEGCWTSFVEAGELISKGQILGEVTDFFGNVVDRYYAEFDGVVMYNTVSLAVTKDSPLVAYGKL
ncbi:MAG: M14 family metallopeptidase [Clostridium sp.]|nr:M14 family metallopeptidase [Clostridium sp.]